jgi:hypothetical protein
MKHVHIHVHDDWSPEAREAAAKARAAGSHKTPYNKGTAWKMSGNLAKQGFKPKQRTGRGPTNTEAFQAAWGHAIKSKSPVVLAATGYGLQILPPHKSLAHGQPHFVITPEGDVHKFDPHLGND